MGENEDQEGIEQQAERALAKIKENLKSVTAIGVLRGSIISEIMYLRRESPYGCNEMARRYGYIEEVDPVVLSAAEDIVSSYKKYPSVRANIISSIKEFLPDSLIVNKMIAKIK